MLCVLFPPLALQIPSVGLFLSFIFFFFFFLNKKQVSSK